MKLSHENKVEKFYSHGSNKRGLQEGGYLSFGYWVENIEHYHQAVEALVNRMLQFEKPIYSGKVLNVACGYGAETIRILDKIQPGKIIAIDIRKIILNLPNNIINQKMYQNLFCMKEWMHAN